jgi:hypothetical protein
VKGVRRIPGLAEFGRLWQADDEPAGIPGDDGKASWVGSGVGRTDRPSLRDFDQGIVMFRVTRVETLR